MAKEGRVSEQVLVETFIEEVETPSAWETIPCPRALANSAGTEEEEATHGGFEDAVVLLAHHAVILRCKMTAW
jgi:hypothetical protein